MKQLLECRTQHVSLVESLLPEEPKVNINRLRTLLANETAKAERLLQSNTQLLAENNAHFGATKQLTSELKQLRLKNHKDNQLLAYVIKQNEQMKAQLQLRDSFDKVFRQKEGN